MDKEELRKKLKSLMKLTESRKEMVETHRGKLNLYDSKAISAIDSLYSSAYEGFELIEDAIEPIIKTTYGKDI